MEELELVHIVMDALQREDKMLVLRYGNNNDDIKKRVEFSSDI